MRKITELLREATSSLFTGGALSAQLTPEIQLQLKIERLKATSKLVPSLLFGNIFLVCFAFFTIKSFPNTFLKYSLFWISCAVCIGGVKVWHTKKNKFNKLIAENTKSLKKHERPFVFVAIILGCLWATLPPLLPYLANSEEQIIVIAILAALLCISGFVLASMPVMAFSFLTPLIISTFSVLFFFGTDHVVLNAMTLIIYIGFIQMSALSQTRSIVKLIVSSQEVAKQQKTISLLLKDFEQHSSDWLWETDENMKFCSPLKSLL